MKLKNNGTSARHKALAAVLILAVLTAVSALSACGGSGSASELPPSPFDGREASDMSAYSGLSGYGKELRFYDITTAEIDELMKDGESFIFVAAYADCEYCNVLIPYLNDALLEADTRAGYLDTRRDPEWMNNADIDDYDLFVKRFGKYLGEDDSGNKHLFTPDLYVIRNGRVRVHHQGVVEGLDDPSSPLTASQEEELKELLSDMIAELK